MKPILCLDFDGVCNSYHGWKGPTIIDDDAVPGLFEFLKRASKEFAIFIYSSRSNHDGGIDAMKAWFADQHHKFDPDKKLPELHFAIQKPPAFLTIDDRAICFNGEFPDVSDLVNFKPWNRDGSNVLGLQPFCNTCAFWGNEKVLHERVTINGVPKVRFSDDPDFGKCLCEKTGIKRPSDFYCADHSELNNEC